ncbi:MAG: precorrin-6A/cobalt-precorrin-6A reductase [Minwuia sp.]|uniref:precorrin-6A/cobalt-precorrin-6A reductase n=1 Tax=Minwuia sp. TaxID=2493630 RepID=UPI003A8A5DBA
MKVLLLAGTAEARAIATGLSQDGRFKVIASLAGATETPADLGVETQSGGFGGAGGLRDFIAARGIDLLVDATHPFAAQMKAHASAQAIPVLHVIRPAWTPRPGWTVCGSLAEAARALPADARAFLALGQRHLQAFADHPAQMLVRSVDAPSPAVAPGLDPGASAQTGRQGPRVKPEDSRRVARFTFIKGHPGTVAEETGLMRRHRITHLVCRNSGGRSGQTKLDAAAQLGVRTIVIDRPPPPPGEIVPTAEAALDWCLRRRREG